MPQKYKNALDIPKKQKVPTYNFTPAQIEKLQQDARWEGIRIGIYSANAMYAIATLTVLHDQDGYGQTRLKRKHLQIQKLFEEITDGEIEYEDLAKVLRDECNINLIVERPDNTPVDAMEIFRQLRIGRKGYKVRIR